MNHCKNCNVEVDPSLEKCPLCGTVLTDQPAEKTMYPRVVKKTTIDRRAILYDGYFYLTFFVIAICALLNIVFWDGTPWFLVIAASLLYVWVLVQVTIISDLFPGLKALCQMGSLFALFFVLDYVSGLRGWSIEYILPLILGLGTAYIDFFAFFHKSYWRDSLVYAILFLGMGLLPLILYLNGITHAFWPMALCTLASILTVLGILRFAIRQLSTEMKKRFHM